jgi:pSer/pThr/pTyr-binding forkhead associated (FHA) protein
MPRSTRHRAPLARLSGLATATALSAAIVAAPAHAADPQDTSVERVRTLVEPSIVQLHATFKGLVRDEHGDAVNGGTPVEVESTCSGFIVNAKGYIATSGRCMDIDVATDALIDKAAEKAFKDHPELTAVTSLSRLKAHAQRAWSVVSASRGHRERPDREVTATSDLIAAQTTDGNELPVSVRRVRGPENGDVALVKVQAQDLPALELAQDADIQPGIPSVSVGFRGSEKDAAAGLGSVFEQGAIGEERTVDGGLNRAFEVKAAISPAMSGGPTVDLKGRVLGVTRSRSPRSAQASGLMSPATEIEQLLRDVGAPNDVGDASRAYRQGLDAFFRGDRATALARLGQALKVQPELKQAEQLRDRAQRLPAAKEKGDGGWPELMIALLSSPVLAAALGAVGIRRRRRNRPDDDPTVTPAAAHQAADDAPTLLVEDGRRVAVNGDVVIGRRRADLVLDDARVSRRHAVVRPVDDGVEIEDLGSANGTSVNGAAISGSKRLRNGDVVLIGGIRLTAHTGPSRDSVTVLAANASGPSIVVTRGPQAGRRHPIGTELIIGRHDADLRLEDPQVSRRHAVVRAIDGELEIEDLASANGTFVNGSRLTGAQRLHPGDEITIGAVALEVQTAAERDADETVRAA